MGTTRLACFILARNILSSSLAPTVSNKELYCNLRLARDSNRPELMTGATCITCMARFLGKVFEKLDHGYSSTSNLGVNKRIPFYRFYELFIDVASSILCDHLGSLISLCSPSFLDQIKHDLAEELSLIGSETLMLEFSAFRAISCDVIDRLFLPSESEDADKLFNSFHKHLIEGESNYSIFKEYPLLSRLLSFTCVCWIRNIEKLLSDVANDLADIKDLFHDGRPVGTLISIQCRMSDPHNGRRSVCILEFSSTLTLVYKPRCLEPELRFYSIISWLNSSCEGAHLYVPTILDKKDRGWMELIQHSPCEDRAGVRSFYHQSGILAAVLYFVGANDMHYENVIAYGSIPVAIDLETILQPKMMHEKLQSDYDQPHSAIEHVLWNSVLRTGLFPVIRIREDLMASYDFSGLGYENNPSLNPVSAWTNVNTDRMKLQLRHTQTPNSKNRPFTATTRVDPCEYVDEITKGFKDGYRAISANKKIFKSLLRKASHGLQTRYLLRPTYLYANSIRQQRKPNGLRSQEDYFKAMKSCWAGPLERGDQALFLSELNSLWNNDIPLYHTKAADRHLYFQGKCCQPLYFEKSGLEQAIEILDDSCEEAMQIQLSLIETSFSIKNDSHSSISIRSAKASLTASQRLWGVTNDYDLTRDYAIQEAIAIAQSLINSSIEPKGSAPAWITHSYVPSLERSQLHNADHSLYSGLCGISIFFAALGFVTNEEDYLMYARKIIDPLCSRILERSFSYEDLRQQGIGVGVGVGSSVYSFVKLNELMGSKQYLEAAQELSSYIDDEMIERDACLDILGGSAGAAIALISLHARMESDLTYGRIVRCGDHLIKNLDQDPTGYCSWPTLLGKRLTGMSHGAAGISYALMRIWALTKQERFLEAALDGIKYEQSLYSCRHENWPDYRDESANQETMYNATSWCHGYPGIGMARLGCLRIFSTETILDDFRAALDLTVKTPDIGNDQLCCGNFGLVDFILSAGLMSSDHSLIVAALERSHQIISHSKRHGHYRFGTTRRMRIHNPGFFQGLAGIGYQILRVVGHEKLPSILLFE